MQALDEVEDLRAAIEYDEEYIGNASIFIEPLSSELTSLRASIEAGNYQPASSDLLDFIGSIKNIDHHIIPFWPMLKPILETHKLGYQQPP
ncbi:MAG: hypothetical protein ACERLB_13330 [Gammaproteobacteria bacterium]